MNLPQSSELPLLRQNFDGKVPGQKQDVIGLTLGEHVRGEDGQAIEFTCRTCA